MSGPDLDRFFTLARGLLAILDEDGRVLRASAAWEEVVGIPPDQLIGRPVVDLVHPSDRKRARMAIAATRRGDGRDPIDLRFGDGVETARWLEWSATVDPSTGRLYAAARDVTGARRTEDELRRAAERYRHLFESVPVPMIVCDAETRRIVAANDAASRQYGHRREALIGLFFDRLVVSDGQQGGAIRHRRKNGSTFEVQVVDHAVEYDGRPARLVMADDVSERRLLEEQLYEAQKMEAIGRLAGGVAHDFNNLLTAINGYSQLLVASLDPSDPRHEDAEQIRLAGERATALTSQLLTFSRRQLLETQTIDVNEVIESLASMLRRLLGATVDLSVETAATEPVVVADRSRLEQVIVNLSINARDAMPTGGTLRIATRDLRLARARRMGDGMARAGRYVVIDVTDSGVGMDDSTRRRAFEPFFTTKEHGRGTGLGLATAHGTVRQTGGFMRVSSARGKGATFEIYLPAAVDSDPAVAG